MLQTDASEVGLGSALSQIHNGMEYPVTFVSRKLLPHKKNYVTIDKECLAVKLLHYLRGCEFALVTDHAPLKWMAHNKECQNNPLVFTPAGLQVYSGTQGKKASWERLFYVEKG